MRGVSNTNTLAPSVNDAYRPVAVDRLGGLFTADVRGLAARAGAAGRLICAGDAAVGDLVLGQTSFVATTPTFAINVPTGSLIVPVEVVLQQAGTVAGGAISVVIEVSSSVGIYASGGTAEKQVALYTSSGFTTGVATYSNPTTTAGYGMQIAHWLRGPDVSSAEGAPTEIIWRPDVPFFLLGPVALKIYTWAGTTGPSWLWSLKFADLPPAMLTN
jgi:hypothetical protein